MTRSLMSRRRTNLHHECLVRIRNLIARRVFTVDGLARIHERLRSDKSDTVETSSYPRNRRI